MVLNRLGVDHVVGTRAIAYMQLAGLAVVNDGVLSLTEAGLQLGIRMIRKHRLAQCFLVGMLRLDLCDARAEASRWDGALSDGVERRLFDLLGCPAVSPGGQPIPLLPELDRSPGEGLSPGRWRAVALGAGARTQDRADASAQTPCR